ncbi:uncharacterized protein LOC129907172 [Episyrphus balteatus]|uniref:uncharacterized protein LOC129907172 n=1 Tax=Episyrphus balteatus TaxID=286459 RepID=UPI002486438D|nr:uncharacterized protein LOC129907172 [Episyrphus balteatus]
MLRIWKDHFCNLYNGDDEANPAQRQIAPFNIDDEGQHFRPPDLEEVKAVISKLKSNKAAGADGLAAELFKAAGDDLVRSMHQLICRIWSEESMPTEWNLSIVCPILKKGDPLTFANYRGISLLNISYKILSAVLCERLQPFVNNLIGPYRCCFRPGKSTIYQIFTLRQILEKNQEQQIDTQLIIGRTQRDVNGAFVSIETEAEKLGLRVNEGKTKYMLSSKKDTQHRRIGHNVTIDSHNFEVVKNFIYLG